MSILGALTSPLAWRWRRAQESRYLRRTFQNGQELVTSLSKNTPAPVRCARTGP